VAGAGAVGWDLGTGSDHEGTRLLEERMSYFSTRMRVVKGNAESRRLTPVAQMTLKGMRHHPLCVLRRQGASAVMDGIRYTGEREIHGVEGPRHYYSYTTWSWLAAGPEPGMHQADRGSGAR
jgi:hypothetical protein